MRSLIICLIAAGVAGAQQPITLQEAIQMAQKQGPQAQVARSARDGARSRNDAFNAGLRPQVEMRGNAANMNRGIIPVTLPDGRTELVSQAQNQSDVGLFVSQKIPLTGGTLSVGSVASRIDQFNESVTNRYYQTTPFLVTLQQDLFKPRTLVWDEKAATLQASVAERSYLEAREDVAGNIAGAFFDLYAAEMSVKNATANVSVNDTLYTLNTGRFEVGKIGEN